MSPRLFYRLRAGEPEARTRRVRWLVALAGCAFAAGAVVALTSSGGRGERELAHRFAEEWTRGRYAQMYDKLAPASGHTLARAHVAALLRADRETATVTGAQTAGPARSLGGGSYEV